MTANAACHIFSRTSVQDPIDALAWLHACKRQSCNGIIVAALNTQNVEWEAHQKGLDNRQLSDTERQLEAQVLCPLVQLKLARILPAAPDYLLRTGQLHSSLVSHRQI